MNLIPYASVSYLARDLHEHFPAVERDRMKPIRTLAAFVAHRVRNWNVSQRSVEQSEAVEDSESPNALAILDARR